jgi:hypothetical protein
MIGKDVPADAAAIARLVRKADDVTAVKLLQVWGAKQRVIGARDELVERVLHAQA